MASMMITSEFNLGDTVYLKTDIDQKPYMVKSIHINPGQLTYEVSNNEVVLNLYDFEISVCKNVTAL